MEQNMQPDMQPNNNNINPIIWVIIGISIAVIIFTGGYILTNSSTKSQPTESAELKNPTTVEEQTAASETLIPTEVPKSTEAPVPVATPVPAAPDAREEVVLDAAALEESTVGTAPVSSDGIIYQADVYEYLTLRSAPSTSAAALSLLPPYTRMQIIENSNATMAKVYLIDSYQEGYVNKEYLSPEGSVMKRAGKTPSVSITDNTIYYADVYETLTLRDAASTNAREIGVLYSYAAMQIVERSGKMAYVYALDSGQTGWVNTEYIVSNINNCTRAGRSAPASSSSYNLYYADVNEFLTLRDAPSTSGGEIVKIPRYGTMQVLEWTNSEFAYVQYGNMYGYVMSKYLKIAAD